VDQQPDFASSALRPRAVRVSLAALSLKEFRNLRALSATFEPTLVAISGANGAGKTNLLEAISLLGPGRGLRRATLDEITQRGAGHEWTVAATLRRDGEEARIGTGLADEARDRRQRKVRINGASAPSPDALLDYLRVVWLTPAMDGLLTGPAGDRRRFLDRLVLTVDAAHARRTRNFDRLLAQRNKLLEQGGENRWMEALESQLAEHAVAVALARAETVALLGARMGKRGEDMPMFPAGRLALTGGFEEALSGRSAAEAELCYRASLAADRSVDRAAGRTLQGPHRSDLEVVMADADVPAALASTGEQKALLLGLILAHAELVSDISGMTPILLLDEVAAHLDSDRRKVLFAALEALGAQAFMTGTDAALFDSLPRSRGHFCLCDGRLDPLW
jgi:DNA replication and repair protein RecF